MSLFSFLKTVGTKLLGEAMPNASALKKELDSFNLGTNSVDVSIAGDTATLKGMVKDQASFEKAVLAIGNAHGIAIVDTTGLTVENSSTTAPVFYTVKSGDNLWKIAESQYGKGKGDKNTLIFEANKPMLTSPDKIYPGQVLRIPAL